MFHDPALRRYPAVVQITLFSNNDIGTNNCMDRLGKVGARITAVGHHPLDQIKLLFIHRK